MSRSATSTWFLNASRDGDSTTSQGSLVQCFTTLSVKKFFIISNLAVPLHSGKRELCRTSVGNVVLPKV